jgi:hypothetical protein
MDCLSKKSLLKINICGIRAIAFHCHIKKKKNKFFYTTFSEIERIIDERLCGEAEEDKKEILKQLPKEYHEYADVFLKWRSDLFPLSRSNIDFKIHLEDGADPNHAIGHGPIYKMNTEELEASYKYMIENLNKGFIAPSLASFASPILIARNPSSGKLCFCVDYWKLNAITKKNRYSIPLVDELMDCLAGAKFFTKLDIR